MVHFRLACAAALLASGALAACTSQSTAPYTPTTNSPFGAKVQLSVGTANIFGDARVSGVAMRGLNVVVTSRQPAGYQTPGDTLPLVSTPSLSGPMVLPRAPGIPDNFGATVQTGPGPQDVGKNTMTGTLQPNPGAPGINPSTFGVSGNASGWGIEPFNYTAAGGNGFGQPASYVPWNVPLYDAGQLPSAAKPDFDAFVPWGGPPAFDPTHDGKGTRDGKGEPSGLLGVEEGLDVFAGVATAAGTYTLAEFIQTNASSGTLHATATLRSTALLPAISAPSNATMDGNGGATLVLSVPAGVSEAYLQVVDIGPDFVPSSSGGSVQPASCNSASASVPVYYTFFAQGSGTHTFTLGDNSGPGAPGSAVPSLCNQTQNVTANSGSSFTTITADNFTVQAIGFDYPVFEAAYPQSLGKPLPVLAGPSGQSDITISAAQVCKQSGTAASCAYVDAPASKSRMIRR